MLKRLSASTTIKSLIAAMSLAIVSMGIIAGIASANVDQSAGIDQINTTLMDEATRQNAALVEENAASAKALEEVAATPQEGVGQFRLAKEMEVRPVVAAVANATWHPPVKKVRPTAPAKANGRGAVAQLQSTLSTAFKQDPAWEEF